MLDLGKEVKKAVQKQGMLAWQYGPPGVSDAITMGGEGTFPFPEIADYAIDIDTLHRHAFLTANP